MDVKARIQKLRELMAENGIDAYIVSNSDPHQSEYMAEHWKVRSWISGFTGSNGTVVVTKDDAGLWTDGRYYIQAEKQLSGSGIRLFKAAEPNVPSYVEWISDTLKEGSYVGFDGWVFSTNIAKEMEKNFKQKGMEINKDINLLDHIWEDRPKVSTKPAFNHDGKFAGKTTLEKLTEVRREMKKKSVDYYLISSLDDIAWLFNIRGSDVRNNPVVASYALISMEYAYLFIDTKKAPQEVQKSLEDNKVEVKDYENILLELRKLDNNKRILLDPNRTSIKVYCAIPSNCVKIEETDITTNLKALKNDIEIESLKRCQVRDGVAMVKFLYWLYSNIGKERITETSSTEKLEGFRREQEYFVEPSFNTIAAYKDHAAMMHYNAYENEKCELKAEGLFLVDSGGQYFDGTTDITRTMVLGSISKEEKEDFTLVLKAHIALCKAKFLYGATGSNLDILARQPLWERGIDYKCGTGHGVGFFLNVHEGPQRFHQIQNNARLEKGMIITNEPGIYREDKHGIRTENTLLVVEDELTEFGQFMKFEVISLCPIDLEGIDTNLLTEKEIEWLNEYHKNVYTTVSPYLNQQEDAWLKNATREL
ncbi:aminopeptidase P family protein [Alkaliphilus sp. B6464]|uniref:aminopeptidase P family protein n=1 Tax=Alkaliphilus sp. B6464 TaxID=2731219 RepID=UPI001BAE0371|nr:aminopeptidase P family protein [Alkaliphilus sp. B6464]QUH21202.1 aminopeptidase P family protein [Alkaliphilus sp. B6464]